MYIKIQSDCNFNQLAQARPLWGSKLTCFQASFHMFAHGGESLFINRIESYRMKCKKKMLKRKSVLNVDRIRCGDEGNEGEVAAFSMNSQRVAAVVVVVVFIAFVACNKLFQLTKLNLHSCSLTHNNKNSSNNNSLDILNAFCWTWHDTDR